MEQFSQFGMTKEEAMEQTKTSAQRTADWLRLKRSEERNKVFKHGIKGLRLNHYKQIAEMTSGVRPGMWGLLAKSHIGKTTLLVSMCGDMLRSNDGVKCIMYAFDDDKDYMRHMLIAFLSEVDKNEVDCKASTICRQEKVDKAYAELVGYAESGRFILKDYDDIEHFDDLLADMKAEIKDCNEMCVFLDGQANLDCDVRDIRAANVYKANMLKRVSNQLKMPVLLTLEVPKTSSIWRPEKEDVMESVKYTFNCVVIIAISLINKDTYSEPGYTVLVMDLVKNKFGKYKDYIFAMLQGEYARLMMAKEAEKAGFMALATDFDDSWSNKNKKGK